MIKQQGKGHLHKVLHKLELNKDFRWDEVLEEIRDKEHILIVAQFEAELKHIKTLPQLREVLDNLSLYEKHVLNL